MAAKVKVAGWTAILNRGRWVSGNAQLENTLNAMLRFRDEIGGEDPNPEYTIARRSAAVLGGEVVEYDRPVFDPNVVY